MPHRELVCARAGARALRSDDPYETGLALSAKGQHLQAIEQFERALATRPDDPRVLFALGNTARALGLSQAAEEFFGRVLKLEPQRLEALVNLANLLRARGQASSAVALLEPALAHGEQAASAREVGHDVMGADVAGITVHPGLSDEGGHGLHV